MKCDHPLKELNSALRLVNGYSDPALVGSNVTIICPSGDEDTGNESAAIVVTCMSNGLWSTDPRRIKCASGNQVSVHIIITMHVKE